MIIASWAGGLPNDLTLAINTAQAYAAAIRSAVRGFWSDVFDWDQFYDAMESTVTLYLPQAWYAGARECGIAPSELSPEERIELRRAIVTEINAIRGFADAIEQAKLAGSPTLTAFLPRAALWGSRYDDLKSRARVMACEDQKLEWVVDRSKESCASCLKLAGKVKRASYWRRMGIEPRRPPNYNLDCKGWGCGCQLLPTTKPLSKGPLPGLP